MQNYLPSKQFQARVLIIIIFVGLFFGVRFIYGFVKNKLADRKTVKVQQGVTVKSIIQKDSNANGIADWEETLWGKDPNKNGPENKEYIMAKKAELAKNDENVIENSNELKLDNNTSAENQQLSKEFFATIAALQQSGDLNQASIDSISEAIGQKIVPETLPDIYTDASIRNTIEANSANISAYYLGFKDLVERYQDKDIGNEMTFISQGLKNNDPQVLAISLSVAESYKSFAKELLEMPTPTTIAPNAVNLANSYVKTGMSIESLAQLITDPIIGMQGLINYKKESDQLLLNIQNL